MTHDVLDIVALVNPAPAGSDAPVGVFSSASLLEILDEMTTTIPTTTLTPTQHDPDRKPRRSWLVPVAAGFGVVLAIGLASLLFSRSGQESPPAELTPTTTAVATTTTTLTDELAPIPTTPEAEAPAGLEWTKSGSSFPEPVVGFPSTLVSDGDQFFTIIGNEVASSSNGFVWETLSINNMPTGARPDWFDVDAAASKILLLNIEGRQASTVLIDIASGEANESVLPFEFIGAVEDLRGFVALNRAGEAVALLNDPRERSIGETPAFFSADGINWTQIPEGQLPTGVALQTAALGEGFVVVVDAFDQPSSTFWHSPDGRTWETAQADGTLPGALVSWGDSAISYVETAFGPQAISANPAYLLATSGGEQLIVDLPPLEAGGTYGPLVAAGGVGIAAFAPVGPGRDAWFVEYSPDGVVWTRQSLPFSGLDPFAGPPAANTDRVLVNVSGEIWVGTSP